MKKKKSFLNILFGLVIICSIIDQGSLMSIVNCPIKDKIVDIDEVTQEALITEAERDCLIKIYSEKKKKNSDEDSNLDGDSNENDSDESSKDPTKLTCRTTWDSVMCWPETLVNQTVYLSCPNYIDKFNIKNKVVKRCEFNPNASKAFWSKSNYSLCSKSENLCNTTCNIESHLIYINIIRICGYVISMVSLLLSIVILFRPKLRCPRNYVHINLFVAFAVRTILVMLVDSILNTKSTLEFISETEKVTSSKVQNYIPCKIMMVMFRYSGSVYHVAIFAEAIYLVLLLKFPYYNEAKGSKFCIIVSWTLPLLWMTPWIFVRAFVHNYWCWQTESTFNLILKIPHTLLLISNITCAVFIIRILYSKMRMRNLSREKIIKYRRLAKSILILIPIFGLHFIFFAWLPYASLVKLNIGDCFELVSTYIETSFNAFQGMVVAITCCFIHREVRIEFILYGCQLLKKIKCLQSLDCLNSDYIRQMRYLYHESRGASLGLGYASSQPNDGMLQQQNQNLLDKTQTNNSSINNNNNNNNQDKEKHSIFSSSNNNFNPKSSKKKPSERSIKYKNVNRLEKRQSTYSVSSNLSNQKKYCCCLFSDKKNDFFNDTSSSMKNIRKKKFGFGKFIPRSNSFQTNKNTKKASIITNGTLIQSTTSSPPNVKFIFDSTLNETTTNKDINNCLLNQTNSTNQNNTFNQNNLTTTTTTTTTNFISPTPSLSSTNDKTITNNNKDEKHK